MMTLSRVVRFAVVCVLAVFILIKLPASAQQAPRGITISPAFQQVSIAADKTEQPIAFSLTNNESTPKNLVFSTQDFNTLDETGGLFFVGANGTDLQKKYGLAKWLSLEQTQVTVPAKQTIKLNADIVNIPSMPAGGHYGALLVQLAGQQFGSAGQNSVGIHPVASSLLFVTKLGGDTHILNLTNVYIDRHLLAFPSSVTLRFSDDGNTQLIPRGVVSVTSLSGKLVSRAIVNENSGIILPQSYRRYGVQLDSISKSLIPGRYKLNVEFRFDGINQFRTYQTSFWVIPAAAVGAALIIVILIAVLIRAIYKRQRQKASKATKHKAPKPKKIIVKED